MGEEVGRAVGIPVDEFTEKAWAQLAAGSDHVIVGSFGPEEKYLGMVKQRRDTFESLSDMILKNFGSRS
jgi:hypothetical protein